MSNFLWDLVDMFSAKTDSRPRVAPNNDVSATDLNLLKGAVEDTRLAFLNGEMRPNPNGVTGLSEEGTYRCRSTADGEMEVSQNGEAWLKIDRTDKRNVTAWGADPTGVEDSTEAIQNAIDYAIYTSKRGPVFLDGHKFKTSDTIHLGYGELFHAIALIGPGYNYRGFGEIFTGACIIPTFNDRPVINVQGARGTKLKGFSVFGLLYDWVADNSMGNVSPDDPDIDDTDPDNWNGDDAFWEEQMGAPDVGRDALVDSRYCPYAAITIDAYSGVRPGTSYPDVDYPTEHTGVVAQYGKAFSSDVLIEDIQITGFTVGIANQPCDADGNADFTIVRRVNFDSCKWAISVCNTQSRNFAIENVKMGNVYCGLTSDKHGRQNGKFNGAIINLSMGASIKIFEFGTLSIVGPVEFTNFYGEAMWRIGDVVAGTASETSLRFRQCLFSFEGQQGDRGVPASLLGGQQQAGDFAFIGCTFNNFIGVAAFDVMPQFDGCQFFSYEYATTEETEIASAYRRHALNFLCGGAVLPRFGSGEFNHRIKYTLVDLDTGTRASNIETTPGFKWGKRNACIPAYVRTVMPRHDTTRDEIVVPKYEGTAINKASEFASTPTLVDRTLTMVFNSLPDYHAFTHGLMPGDVLWDDETGTVFFIRSRSTVTVIAEQQNNYRDDGGGGYEAIDAISLTTGNFYSANTRFYVPEYTMIGALTSGSDTITGVQRDDGFASFIESSIAVNDRIWTDVMKDRIFPEDDNVIDARSNAGQTITVSGLAVRTEARKKLSFFMRAPPSNQATRDV
jgi:hypothetical protein